MADWKSSRLTGSSPLTRGKPISPPRWSSETRLIPAHAGKTLADERAAIYLMAHPRSRGENAEIIDDGQAAIGSSPLTRGKLSFSLARRRR